MRVFEAVERRPLAIPILDVMGADGSFMFVPEVKEKGYFDIDYRKNELVVVAGNYIGQVPLTEQIVINVRPKVPIMNLARIIGIASQPIRCLDFFRRKYSLDGVASATLLEAMGRSLLASLRELDAEGLYREYVEKHGISASPRGRINVKEYVQRYLPKASRTVLPCTYYSLVPDTAFNRLIKRTIHELASVLLSHPVPDKATLRELQYFFDKLESVPLDFSRSLEHEVRNILLSKHVPALRHYYLDILDVCFIILQGSGVELTETSGRASLHSLVVNLEDAFELYLRAFLSVSSDLQCAEITVLDGNNEGISTLFTDNAKYTAKPDIVIKRAGTVCLLGDVKYKTKLTEADRYQLIAHALSYGATKAFFVTPANSPEDAGSSYVGAIGITNQISVYHYKMDLDSCDLGLEESNFAAWILELI